ncbi:MAG: CinA family nicotinamide mononucleotide deamidase-related protein [Nitrospirae bacterium]|nr:MAG: CinA family nicotinamide mononucleotide deamidase-related protein [Nitrospirota bacterium]
MVMTSKASSSSGVRRPCATEDSLAVAGGIIAIGSELLLDGYPETNSLFLAEGLATCGIRVRWKMVVGDSLPEITEALRAAVRYAEVIVVTGGLGSTIDDCTREAVARVTGCPLRKRPHLVEVLAARYGLPSRPLTAAVFRQAQVPQGARVLENPAGSAPGFVMTWKGRLLIVLPGVPREARMMFEERVAPLLRARYKNTEVLERHAFHTFGLPELDIQECLHDVIAQSPDIRFAFLPSPLGVSVLLTRWSADHEIRGHRGRSSGSAAQKAKNEDGPMERVVRAVRSRLGDAIYAEGSRTMEEVVGLELVSRSLTLAVAESCTGGLIGHRLTDVPGSSRYVDRVLVTYSNRAKCELLGVSDQLLKQYGAVSAQVAEAMAKGIRERSRSDVGLSVTGIAGPGGGSSKKPVGLVFVGVDGIRGCVIREFRFSGDRQTVKLRASQGALDHLRRYLLS